MQQRASGPGPAGGPRVGQQGQQSRQSGTAELQKFSQDFKLGNKEDKKGDVGKSPVTVANAAPAPVPTKSTAAAPSSAGSNVVKPVPAKPPIKVAAAPAPVTSAGGADGGDGVSKVESPADAGGASVAKKADSKSTAVPAPAPATAKPSAGADAAATAAAAAVGDKAEAEGDAGAQAKAKLKLHSKWTIWSRTSTKLESLAEFGDIPTFWESVRKSIKTMPPVMVKGQDQPSWTVSTWFTIMRNGTQPDMKSKVLAEQNVQRFVLKVRVAAAQDVWTLLMLSLVGEQFRAINADLDVCGLGVEVDKVDRAIFSIWWLNPKKVHDKAKTEADLLEYANAALSKLYPKDPKRVLVTL